MSVRKQWQLIVGGLGVSGDTSGADHNVACHLVHDNHDPKPGRSTDGTWPDNPSNRSLTHQGGSQDETQEDQEPYSTNRGRWGDVDVVDGRI